tara:strand:+ start:235 stop:492 length:258 start_codon:yes stop_codon:yes gene_type:complete
MDKFKVIAGRKNKNDRILLYNGKAVSFEDIGRMCIFMMMNEDNLYPKPRYKGRDMFIEYIREVLDTGKIPSQNKYQLGKKLKKLG